MMRCLHNIIWTCQMITDIRDTQSDVTEAVSSKLYIFIHSSFFMNAK